MKANKLETNLSAVGNLYQIIINISRSKPILHINWSKSYLFKTTEKFNNTSMIEILLSYKLSSDIIIFSLIMIENKEV